MQIMMIHYFSDVEIHNRYPQHCVQGTEQHMSGVGAQRGQILMHMRTCVAQFNVEVIKTQLLEFNGSA